MTIRGTFLLLGILAGLLAYLWVGEVRPRRRAAAGEAPPALLAVPSAAIARVELEERGRRLTALRGNGGWVDEAGRRWREDVVSGLVDTLGALRPVMVVEHHPARPGEYGLGPDAPRLRLLGEDGRAALTLELGERNPPWTGLYARIAERPEVVLVGAVLDWELEKLREAAPEP